ncbi:PIN domain-containing protein [Paenibacillus sediminis]|uniref:Nucleic acid-binding protein n=1 Tax=Paenibacillus sediminis TaxID=664909 RepID=A0ABS4H2X9_9BACL|nr:PIN domain-containing protein [Paenibacillus sediminis]MBP1936875.1 putative nucleic acid-binding protein [Paenibacillus sediminis]
MRVLLDTNIIIHRETSNIMKNDIGVLFRWLDKLGYSKCVHPVTIEEIKRYKDTRTVNSMVIKLDSYQVMKTEAPMTPIVSSISKKYDKNPNDINDTKLLNELVAERVDMLITEDRKIAMKASQLNLSDKVFTIDSFLEKVTSEHPDLINYKILSVKKEYIGNINIDDPFFDSLKADYHGFERWFNKKADEMAYICKMDNGVAAFLYLKIEGENENYSNISPSFSKKKRLKIGTFKVTMNGYKLGERFLKIIFDNALKSRVDEIYVTIFDRSIEQIRLINLLTDFGFTKHGTKDGAELVYTRDFQPAFDGMNPKYTFPYIDTNKEIFITPIYPEYHTNLFPDSILRTESPADYIENEPFRNAISKVFISRSIERNLNAGDIIVFYRTGGYYESVITTIGIVESVITDIKDPQHFISLCKKRSVFTDKALLEFWHYKKSRPFIVNFLYAYSFPKRINMKRLIELGVIQSVHSAPRGFMRITYQNFKDIIREAQIDERIIIN